MTDPQPEHQPEQEHPEWDTVALPTEHLMEMLYPQIAKILDGDKLTPVNIATVVITLMQIVERYAELTGPQKKVLILKVLTKYIHEELNDTQEERELALLINLTLPSMIDAIVSIDKGQIVIHVKKAFVSLRKCLGCKKV